MKKITTLFLTIILLAGCKSPEKLVQKGYYDAAIDKGIKKVLKGKAKADDKELLDKAFRLANERDQSRVDFLLEEGRPENWDEIYRRYSSLSIRQTKMQRVLPLDINGRMINYPTIDYNALIVEAKTNAAKHFYEKGKGLMELNTKAGYRQAHANFIKAKNYRGSDFPDIDRFIEDAAYLGISRVLIEMDSRLPAGLPESYYEEIRSINTSGLNSQWVEYHLLPLDQDIQYDYYITIFLHSISSEPPVVKTEEYMRKKRIQDGYEYVKDARGNVMKDSLGNDIKVPKYRDLSCTVIEKHQYKAVTIKGDIEYESANPERIIEKIPIAATNVFEHYSGKAIGDRDALTKEDWELIKVDEIPFPTEKRMVLDSAPILRDAITAAIHEHRNLIY